MISIIKSNYYSNRVSPSFVILYRGYYFHLRTDRVKDVNLLGFSEWGCSCSIDDTKIDNFHSLEDAMDYLIDNDDDDWYDEFDRMDSYTIDINSPGEWKDFL